MRNERDSLKFFSPALVALAALLLLVVATLFFTPPASDPEGFGVLSRKLEILRTASSPRLILIGGSNLLFGIDGKLLSSKLDMSVVNMGLCFHFRLPFMLEMVKDSIRTGDIVVISPEYELTAKPDSPHHPLDLANNDIHMAFIASTIDQNPQLLPAIFASSVRHPIHIAQVCQHVLGSARDRIKNLFAIQPQSAGKQAWIYDIDQSGGLVHHLKQKRGADIVDLLIPPPRGTDPSVILVLNEFAHHCRSRGARCVLIPPPLPDSVFARNHDSIRRLENDWRGRLAFPVLGKGSDFSYPESYFHHGRYHLHSQGRRIRTEKMVELLRRSISGNELAGMP